ncbi:MAG: helix-turn-helix transcriptional regulator [Verrucomicrobia bacterium]|nr:helix-turn-helix transcriptional regulator [Verrucomicrobiota bacterium]
MPLLAPIDNTTFIGPLPPPKGPRDKFAHRLNETTSLVDHVFGAKIPKEIAAPTPKQLVDFYIEPLTHHVEKRVALFFQQLVACYETKLHFEIGDTLDQAESAPALKNHAGQKIATRNAAHSSTIPCLIAYRQDEWEAWAGNRRQEPPQGFVYLKGSDLYRNSNATIDMPRDINEADIAIDGKANESALRQKSLALLNRCGQGETTPEEGLKEFIQILSAEVAKKKNLANKEGVKRALELYKEALRQISEAIDVDGTIFEQWLDLQVDSTDDSARVRRTIYHIRYDAIRQNHLSQTEILDKIEQVKNEIFGRMKQERGRYAYMEDAFRHVLADSVEKDADRLRLLKLYQLPFEGYDLRPNGRKMQLYSKTKTRMLQEVSEKIAPLIKEVCRMMERMRHAEVSKRASITRVLRHAKGWRQIDLSAKIKELFPTLPSSQPTISRVETGIRVIDSDYAGKLSQVFKVDAGLFMPHFFNH